MQIILGPANPLDYPPANFRVYGAETGYQFGSVVGAADLNGDGVDDLIVSNRYTSVGNGEVVVVYGSSAWTGDIDLMTPPANVTWFVAPSYGDLPGSPFGQRVFPTGDVDGDGTDDLIAGAFRGDSIGNTRFDAGETYLWYGKPTSTYYLQPDLPSYIDASSGNLLALGYDDCSVAVPVGFEFPFYGEMLDTIHVSSNGFVSFAPIQDPTSFVPACMPDRRPDQSLIAPLWDDLNPADGAAGSGVFALLEGVAPNRRLTIEWKDVPHYPSVGAVTFEATLFDSTGQVLVQYQDLLFGDAAFDNAAAAVIGIENRAGLHGVPVSCSDGTVLGSGVSFRLIPTTSVVETGFEDGEGLFSENSAYGQWHLAGGSCEPDQRSGDTSWHFRFEPACTFDVPGDKSLGALRVPTIYDFPADDRLSFWYRHQTENTTGFDISRAQITNQGTTGIYSDVLDILDDSSAWQWSGVTNLFGEGRNRIDLQFYFDSIDSAANVYLGWMIDDVQIVGCGAEGVLTAGAEAMAFARPEAYCEGSAGLVDAAGSYCPDSGYVAAYQWREGGAPIPGATAISYTIPSTQPSGVYDYSVEIACPGGAIDESAIAPISVVPPPSTVGPTLAVDRNAGDLVFTWSNVSGADEYVVYSSTDPSAMFSNMVGTSPSGALRLSAPIPPEGIVYYLVAGKNAVCGNGAQR